MADYTELLKTTKLYKHIIVTCDTDDGVCNIVGTRRWSCVPHHYRENRCSWESGSDPSKFTVFDITNNTWVCIKLEDVVRIHGVNYRGHNDKGDNMRIGTDVSIEVCRAEGYIVMDYSFTEYKTDPQAVLFRFTKSYPDHIRETMGWRVGDPIIIMDVSFTWDDLWEIYIENKGGIDSMIGGGHHLNLPDIRPREVLNLASNIDAYCGLE